MRLSLRQNFSTPEWLPLIMVVLLGMALLVGGGLWIQHDNKVDESNRRDARLLLCVQIENLKTAVRQEAIENYKNLPRNARLLRIPLTAELRREAARARDAKLERFAPIEGGCREFARTLKIQEGLEEELESG